MATLAESVKSPREGRRKPNVPARQLPPGTKPEREVPTKRQRAPENGTYAVKALPADEAQRVCLRGTVRCCSHREADDASCCWRWSAMAHPNVGTLRGTQPAKGGVANVTFEASGGE